MNSRMIHQIINDRIYSRNIPSAPLDNPISFRPIITKYTHGQVCPLPLPIMGDHPFSVSTTFSPGDRESPWIGYRNAIDTESILRDQITNKGVQKKYVPNALGDMYTVSVSEHTSESLTEFPYLFKKPVFDAFNPGEGISHPFTFYNASRINKPI